METEYSVLSSQQCASGTYPETNASTPHAHILYL
jgi:hypothetical protein